MSAPHVQPIDFTALVEKLRAEGAFERDPNTPDDSDLQELNSTLNVWFTHPSRPGEGAYHEPLSRRQGFCTTGGLLKSGFKVPQSLVHENRRSYANAFRLYFPPELHAQWMHEYFTGNFLNSEAMQLMIQHDNRTICTPDPKDLPDQFSYRLDAPERRRTDHHLFTSREIRDTLNLCRERPALAITLQVYRCAFLEYWLRFRQAVDDSTMPSEQKKEILENLRGIVVLAGSNPSFMTQLLPSIAVQHLARLRQDPDSDPYFTKDDFDKGMKFAIKNGSFRDTGRSISGKTIHMGCAAQHSLTHLAKVDMQTGQDTTDGAALYHIYQSVGHALSRDPDKADALVRQVENAVGQAQNAGQTTFR